MYFRTLCFVSLFMLINQSSIAASFDCKKASASIEHAICDNTDLDSADSVLSQRYSALRKSLSKAAAKILKQEQRKWLKQRLKQCTVDDIACLVDLYQSRINEFESRLGINTVSGLSAQTVGRNVSDFVPIGYKVLDVTEGNLNRDKYTDVILILGQENEQDQEDALRPLLILTRDASNQLHLAARNDHVVLCVECGGMLGDPYQRTAIKNGYFTVEHHGGSSWQWTKYITFKYIPKKSN
ncbi:lysozyme inhibitor LprI family protein [Candidatus Albibeggiatoa sp. nov. BB20]|uniref:lysozyme inhibitor LprI family protein n=1 Tax=Candidatus Albibeggiatoa sp. nov. BB20 TaxID=3162723 RepID=UPI0033653339